ncbi:MAG TPA: hypothetical protein VI999_08660 [Thermoplasmata archaeon]|nr:hypothetical protein [Thermoplasmata archaeon]
MIQAIFVVDPAKIARRRSRRRTHLVVDGGIFVVATLLAILALGWPAVLDVQNPTLLFFAIAALFAIAAYASWSDLRTLRSVNSVMVSTRAFSPPFKPKERPTTADWSVAYKEIASMEPVATKGGFIPAYDVTLRDGLSFQLNALDLLLYVDEKEVRRYAKMLAVIRAEVGRPENRERAARGEDVVIPKERFEAVAGG